MNKFQAIQAEVAQQRANGARLEEIRKKYNYILNADFTLDDLDAQNAIYDHTAQFYKNALVYLEALIPVVEASVAFFEEFAPGRGFIPASKLAKARHEIINLLNSSEPEDVK